MAREWLKAIAVLLVATAVGLAGGLLYGLVLDQVTYTNVDPEDLAQRYKQDYLRLVAADYAQRGDLDDSRARLARLGYDGDQLALEVERATAERAPAARALALLATDLGVSRPGFAALLATATPTITPTPTASNTPTSTPTPTASNTPTPVPTATPLPTATATSVPPTPVPTRVPTRPPAPTSTPRPTVPTAPTVPPSPTVPPPTATPAIDFVVTLTRMVNIQQNGGCQGRHQAIVTVVDAGGALLNGVTVAQRWPEGENRLVTGHKVELPGRAQFDLFGAYTFQVVTANGQPARSQQTRLVTSHYPTSADLVAAGYCTDEADCAAKMAVDPPQLCYGHYSWDVTFQRTY